MNNSSRFVVMCVGQPSCWNHIVRLVRNGRSSKRRGGESESYMPHPVNDPSSKYIPVIQ
jgi:hypothetical protein